MRLVLLIALMLVPATLAGCSKPAETPPTATPTVPTSMSNSTAPPVALAVAAVGAYPANPAFDPAAMSVASGAVVTVTFTNSDTNPLGNHDWLVEGVEGAGTDVIGVGETAEVTFTAPEPGEYRYICSVPGHADRGMVGTLTVT